MHDNDDLRAEIEQLRADMADAERRTIAVAAAMVTGAYNAGLAQGQKQKQQDEPEPEGHRGHLRWFRGGLAALAGVMLFRHFKREAVAFAVAVAAVTAGVLGFAIGTDPGPGEMAPPPPATRPTTFVPLPPDKDETGQPSLEPTTPAAHASSSTSPSPSPSGDAMLPRTSPPPPSPTRPPEPTTGDQDDDRTADEPSPSPDPSQPSDDGELPPKDDVQDPGDQVGPDPRACLLDLDLPGTVEARLLCPSPSA